VISEADACDPAVAGVGDEQAPVGVDADVGGIEEPHFVTAQRSGAVGAGAVFIPVAADAQDEIAIGVQDADGAMLDFGDEGACKIVQAQPGVPASAGVADAAVLAAKADAAIEPLGSNCPCGAYQSIVQFDRAAGSDRAGERDRNVGGRGNDFCLPQSRCLFLL